MQRRDGRCRLRATMMMMMTICVCACTDAYSVKHITYRWIQERAKGPVGYNKELQLPQFEIKGYRVVTKLEKLSTGKTE